MAKLVADGWDVTPESLIHDIMDVYLRDDHGTYLDPHNVTESEGKRTIGTRTGLKKVDFRVPEPGSSIVRLAVYMTWPEEDIAHWHNTAVFFTQEEVDRFRENVTKLANAFAG